MNKYFTNQMIKYSKFENNKIGIKSLENKSKSFFFRKVEINFTAGRYYKYKIIQMKNKINNAAFINKPKLFHWKFILLITLISVILFSKPTYSNSILSNKGPKYYLEMHGIVIQNKGFEMNNKTYIDSAEVGIYDLDNKLMGSLLSNKRGHCYFRLPLNEQYVLKVSKEGLITKTINVDTRIKDENINKYILPFEIEMFEKINDLEIQILKEPIAKVNYNEFINEFDYNYKYTNETNARVKKIYSNYYLSLEKNKNVMQNVSQKRINNYNNIEYNLDSTNLMINEEIKTDVSNSKILQKKINSDNQLKNIDDYNKIPPKDVIYKIQILALEESIPSYSSFFDKCGKASEYYHEGKFKYTLGEFNKYKSAQELLSIIKKIGYEDAFLVAFLKGERIELEDEMPNK